MNQRTTTGTHFKVLCVDDDSYLTDLLQYALSREGYGVHTANSGDGALRAAKLERFDLAILDAKLPDIDGFDLCSRLRAAHQLPAIMLTGRKTDPEMLAGFKHGAEDYVTKPFTMQILIYRVKAVLRSLRPETFQQHDAAGSYRAADSYFSVAEDLIVGDAGSVKLTATEGKVFRLLLQHEERVITAEEIIERVWSDSPDIDSSVVKTHIGHIRRKVARAVGNVTLIHTVPGKGYSYLPGGAPRSR